VLSFYIVLFLKNLRPRINILPAIAGSIKLMIQIPAAVAMMPM
jgi:hypothetical protein